jgi:hypothetical protein
MNNGKRIFGAFLLAAAVFVFVSDSAAQKRNETKPLSETASLAESQKWLTDVFPKNASYKTRATTVAVSNPKFDGCTFSFSQTRRSGSTSTDTMGATRTTHQSKDDIAIQMDKIRSDGISLEDHIYPELQTIRIWMNGFDLTEGSNDGRVHEIVVRHDASGAIKTALMRIQRLCAAKN